MGLATFGIFGSMSSSKYSDLQDACPNNQCDLSLSGDIDDGKLYQTVANIGLGVGVLEDPESPEPAAPRSRVHLAGRSRQRLPIESRSRRA